MDPEQQLDCSGACRRHPSFMLDVSKTGTGATAAGLTALAVNVAGTARGQSYPPLPFRTQHVRIQIALEEVTRRNPYTATERELHRGGLETTLITYFKLKE